MHVLQVMAGGQHGGAETYFVDAVTQLADHGLSQSIVTRPTGGRLDEFRNRQIPLYTARFSNLLRFPTRRTIERAVSEHNPAVVQFWMGRAAAHAVSISGPVKVGWFGGYYDLKRFRGCDYFVGVTQDIVDHIIAQGVDPARARLIHTLAVPETETEPVDRAAFDTPDDKPLILALARLHWKKGLDVLLNALVTIPEAYLWIAGEGPLRSQLENQAVELGLKGRVRFLGWRNDRHALLQAADLCAFPSRYEPFGTVMVEAWAADTPLVAAASNGPKHYVRDGDNGLLVAIDDVDALATALRRSIEEPGLAAELVAGGRRTYEENFTADIIADTYQRFYADICR